MIKRLGILAIAIFLTGLSILLATPAYAVDVVEPVCSNVPAGTDVPSVCRDNNTGGGNPIIGADGVLTKFVSYLSIAIGIIAVFVIIIGGIRFVTSGGDPQAVSGAQKTVLFAIIGLIVAGASQALVIFVLSKV